MCVCVCNSTLHAHTYTHTNDIFLKVILVTLPAHENFIYKIMWVKKHIKIKKKLIKNLS